MKTIENHDKNRHSKRAESRSFTSLQMFHTHRHTIFLCHTPSFTYNFATHNFVLLLDSPPPPLPFLPSPSPLQHVVLIIGRSCLVGLSGPFIGCCCCCLSNFQCTEEFNSVPILVLHQVIVSQPCTDCWYAADPARLQQKKLQSPNFPTVLVDRTLCMILESVSVFCCVGFLPRTTYSR